MERDEIIAVYDAISEDYDKTFKMPSAHIDAFLQILAPGSLVLDAGCGPGVDSVYMKSKGHSVIGVDLSQQMIFLAKQKDSAIPFLCQDIMDLDFKDGFFDAVLASYSLSYLSKEDAKPCLINFHKMLSKGGLLCLGLQEGASGEYQLVEPFNPTLKLWVNVFSMDEIRQLLLETGFEIIQYFMDPPGEDVELPYNKLCLIARKA